jgi:cell wall-associated NlpC family hydrolase
MGALLQPGDVFLTRGTSLFSRLIRVCTRSLGERRSKVNHVGVVVEGGGIPDAVVVEALIKVREHKLWKQYGPPKKDHVAVYRATNLTPEDVAVIVAEAVEQVGRPYGFGKIIAHFLDWLLTGAYFFRRLTSSGNYPICSWLVAHAYAEAGYTFGTDPGAADPDDIWDFVTKKPGHYECIIELGSLSRLSS